MPTMSPLLPANLSTLPPRSLIPLISPISPASSSASPTPTPTPLAHLLLLDSSLILLDCGSPISSPPSKQYIRWLREIAPRLDAILLSQPKVESLGMLTWLVKRSGMPVDDDEEEDGDGDESEDGDEGEGEGENEAEESEDDEEQEEQEGVGDKKRRDRSTKKGSKKPVTKSSPKSKRTSNTTTSIPHTSSSSLSPSNQNQASQGVANTGTSISRTGGRGAGVGGGLKPGAQIYATLPTRELGRLAVEEWVAARTEEEDAELASSGGGLGDVGRKNELEEDEDNRSSEKSMGKKGKGKSKSGVGVKGKGKGKATVEGWKVSLKEVRETFREVQDVRYSQPIHLGGAKSLTPLSLLLLPSGHALGGSIFAFRSPLSPSPSATLLYAPVWNHVKERLVGGGGGVENGRILDAIRHCEAMVVGSERALVTNVRKKERESEFAHFILRTLSTGRSVLVTSDPSARLLEMLVILEQQWEYEFRTTHPGHVPPLCLITRTGKEVIGFLRSLTEWMGGQAVGGSVAATVDETDERGEGVLRFRHLRIFPSIGAFYTAHPNPNQPKVIISTPSSVSHGFSRRLFADPYGGAPDAPSFASTPGNVLIITEKPETDTLGRELWERWNEAQETGKKWGEGQLGRDVVLGGDLQLEMKRKVILEGEELKSYLEEKRLASEREARQRAMLARSRRLMEAEDESSSDGDSSSDEDEDQGGQEDDEVMMDLALGGTGDEGGQLMDSEGNVIMAEPGGGGGRGMKRKAGRMDGGFDSFVTDVAGGEDQQQQMSFDIYVKGDRIRRRNLLKSAATLYLKAKEEQAALTNRDKSMTAGGGDDDLDEEDTAASDGFRAAAAQQASAMTRYRMFPYIERKRKIDAFGETIDVDDWLRRGVDETDEGGAGKERETLMASTGTKRKKEGEAEEPENKPEPPHKFVVEQLNLELRCRVFVIDMEGKNDGRALKSLIPQINPKKLIIVHGEQNATDDLAASFKAISSMTKEILTPGVGETVKVGEDVKSFSMRLADSFMASIKLSQIEDYEIAHVQGSISMSDESSIPILESGKGALAAAIPRSKPLPALGHGQDKPNEDTLMEPLSLSPTETAAAQIQEINAEGKRILPPLPRHTHFIGDMKLARLKAQLAKHKVPARFAGEGTLICGPLPSGLSGDGDDGGTDLSGGPVAVRKGGKGEVRIEGTVGKTYFFVRDQIYGLHAVAG